MYFGLDSKTEDADGIILLIPTADSIWVQYIE